LLLARLRRVGCAELGVDKDAAAAEAAERHGLQWQGATPRQIERALAARRAAAQQV
jgi:hypothetical protein